MEKYQLYRTALDALQFLLVNELDFSETELIVLDGLAQSVTDSMKDILHNHVSEMTSKDAK